MSDLLTIEEAQRRILERAIPLATERLPVARAAGRVLAETAVAAVDLPPFPSSAMDGFALRAADTPGMLPVVTRVAAGAPAGRPLAQGESMGIATGGAVPTGADSVVPIEDVVDHGNEIDVPQPVAEGANVRPRGGDICRGDPVLAAGTRLGPAQLSALAAAGVAEAACGSRPRVVVLATGSELRGPGEPLADGQIYESNTVLLAAGLESAGAAVETLPTVADDEDAHRAAIARGLDADMLVTSGGVSVGPHDLVRRIEAELGVDEVFWGVAVKPGKPLAFGVRGRTLVFGLPGNPVSALVASELFVRPAVRALQGDAEPLPRFLDARLASPVRRLAARDQFVRARRAPSTDGVLVEPVVGQESHMIVRAAGADSLVLVPRGDGEVAAGAPVRFLPLGSY